MNDYAVYLSTVFTVDSMELILVTLKLKYFFIPGILIHYGSSLSLNQPAMPAYLHKIRFIYPMILQITQLNKH